MWRLQKLLSQAGIASRRAAEKLIAEGRVTVNGRTVREQGVKADPAKDDVRVDGRRIHALPRRRYILLNKPAGYVTTRSDPQRRHTVLDLLRIVREYVCPVGRLDYDTEGLLLLTNDGDLAARLMHPRHGVERTYEARVTGVPGQEALRRLRTGISLDGRRTQPAHVTLLTRQSGTGTDGRIDRQRSGPARAGYLGRAKSSPAKAGHSVRHGRNSVLVITIREGRNRQVRRMCEAVGHPVRALRRTRIGPIADRRLKPGMWRELTADEVASLERAAALSRGTKAHRHRGPSSGG